jgi:predicted site-specific integrase-resolvase
MAANATIRDLASHYNISVSTARKWVRDGVIPEDTYIKVHGTYRFDLDRIDRALLPNTQERTQPATTIFTD